MSNFNSILGEIRNILRKDGITNMDSVNHCVAFYILRAMNEELCEKLSIPKQYIFDTFDKDENGNLLDSNKLFAKFYTPSNIDNVDGTGINCFVYYLMNVFNMNEIGEYKLKKVNSFKEIFDLLKKLNVSELNKTYDIVGLIYEHHLATGSTNARDLGQFFTHRLVIKYMIELCEPKLLPNGEIETILDPTMGTGGFLTMAAKYLNSKYNVDWSINSKYIYGCDIDDRLKTLSTLNMLLETGEIASNLINLDTLHNGFSFSDIVVEKFNIILANEPFGLKNIIYKEVCERIKELKINGTKAEPLFLQLMMISLKENGRCAVVVPDGVLFNDAKLHTETRKYLIEKLNLKKVISLEGDFFMNTGVKSSILYFVNDGTTQEVEFSKIKLASGQIAEESLKKVKKADLVAKGYTLFINKYLDNQVVKLAGVEYKKFIEIVEDASYKTVEEFETGEYNFYTCSPIIKKTNSVSLAGKYLIIGSRGTISNAIHYINDKFGLGNNMFAYKTKIENINLKYIYYYLKLNKIHLDNITSRTVIPMISKKSLQEIEIPIPPLAIQQQIVSILDNTYSIINTNKEQISRYEAQKQALIWSSTLNCSVKKLGDICTTSQGTYITPEMKENIGEYPVYGGGGISSYINQFNRENEIVIAKDGVSLECVRFVSSKFCLNHHGWTLKFIDGINKKCMYYILNINQDKIYNLASGSAQKGINQKNFYSIEIPIPSPEVQSSIVQQCEHIDSIITMLSKDNERLEGDNLIQRILESLNQQESSSTQSKVALSDAVSSEAISEDTTPAKPTLDSILEHKEETKSVEKKIVKKPIGKKTSK